MSEEIKPEVQNTSDVAQEEQKTLKETLAEVVAMTKDVVSDAVAAAKDKVAEYADVAGDKLSELAGKAADAVADIKDGIADVVDGIQEKVADVKEEHAEQIADVKEEAAAVKETVVNYAEKTLAELSGLFQSLSESVDRMKRSKEAEAIKSAFYKRLSKEKADAGLADAVEEPTEEMPAEEPAAAPAEAPAEAPAAEEGKGIENPFTAIEAGFKSLYNNYKKERAEYNRQLDAEREDNLVKKQAVIEELKALIEEQGEMRDAFPKFREIQNRWREIGPVPVTAFRDINDTYQLYVEKFYDLVQINRDLRDLDFKKNLEAKEQFCEQAEKLAEEENVVSSFKELQKLHEQWKEYGPVAKEYRDAIWDRFKAATAVINKKYQAYFEGLKGQQAENLAAKTALCEQVEAIAAKEIGSSNEWNTLSRQIEEIQASWRKIGFASKKENQKVYDRFRAACDKFFERKRDYYAQFKDSMNVNMEKKLALIEQAEALKDSTDWKKTTDQLIALQKQWKEIGSVPRKKSEQLWKRFRAACDAFFNERDKQAKPENDYYGNLKAKKALIAEIEAYTPSGDADADQAAARDFAEKWSAIGFVPFKEKEAVSAAYRDAMNAKFPSFNARAPRGGERREGRRPAAPKTEKDILVQKYVQLQQDIATYENNIGFFSASKTAESMIKLMQERIDAAKEELKALEGKIRELEAKEEAENE